MKKKTKTEPNKFKFTEKYLVYFILIIFITVFVSQLIIEGLQYNINQKISETCKDTMIKYRSCEDLLFASAHCEKASIQFIKNNCSLENPENLRWQIKD